MAILNHKSDSDNGKSKLDKNKTDLTHRITSGASTYLSERGFKPIETEVKLSDHWVSDIAGVVEPTLTELQKMKIIPRKPQSVYFRSFAPESFFKKYGNDYWKNDLYKQTPEYKKYEVKNAEQKIKLKDWHDITKTTPSLLTALVEVKVSRSDFTRDSKWTRTSPANLRYLAVPCGMLKRSEYPVGWWVVECDASGQVRRLAQEGTLETVKTEQQMWVIHNIAVRRHHRTEHKWLRDITKGFNAHQTIKKQNYRVSNIVEAMLNVVKSGGRFNEKDAEDCFRSHNIDYNRLPDYTKRNINSLWGVAKGKFFKDKT
jgi:hypothetical protein